MRLGWDATWEVSDCPNPLLKGVDRPHGLLPMPKSGLPNQLLGFALSTTRLPRSALQPLADCIANKLLAWKGRILHRSGRLALIKSTLYAISIFTSISITLSDWLLKAIQIIMKTFLWSGSEVMQNGKCIIAWSRSRGLFTLAGLGCRT
jgi:hypothetical protein